MKHIEKISKYLTQVNNALAEHVRLNEYNFLDILSNRDKECPDYHPVNVPFLCKTLNDESKPRKIIIGPYGSGKTSAIINAILRNAVLMPICDDGIRKCKVALVRNTAGQLETTTLATWLFWTQRLPTPYRSKKPQLIYSYKFRDKYGWIYLDVLFLALDRDSDISKLDSLEITHVYFNELRHIPKKIFDNVQSRIGRFPSKSEYYKQFYEEFSDSATDDEIKYMFERWQPYEPKVYADSNAPKNRHWIAEMEKEKLRKIKVYHQPPALIKNEDGQYVINEEADNLLFQSHNYYLDMIDRGEEFVKVYAQGLYGTVVDGRSVYQLYNDDIHSVDDLPLSINDNIYIGCDYGIICPAILIAQIVGGQIKFIKEFVGEYEAIRDVWKAHVIPFLNLYCKGIPVEIIGDPANTSDGRGQLAELGFEALNAKTNKIETRIAAVCTALNELVRGKPRILVSRQGCPTLREGFIGEYHYRRLKVIGEDKYVDQPNKTHPYSDIHDCAQYLVMKILDDEGVIYANENYVKLPNYKDEYKSAITGY